MVLESPLFGTPVVGFENHAGRTIIGDCTPLGKVLYGRGNTGNYRGRNYEIYMMNVGKTGKHNISSI